jgi:O-methyltransferase involved in polyketide biosynthesis
VIKIKQRLQDSLMKNDHLVLKGNLKTTPLNVFDLSEFRKTVKLFPTGPVAIINEGLLPYFDRSEKTKLCQVIQQILKERGGYWITADVYVKDSLKRKDEDAEVSTFRKEHKLDENRFESYEDAEAFFKSCGLEVVYKEAWVFAKLSSLELISKEKRASVVHKLQQGKPIRQTWCLQRIPDH